jgi:hypothetical protein
MTTMAVRSARNGKVVLSSWLINKSNNNKKSAIFWRAASSSSIPKIDGDKDKKIREEERLSAVIDAVNDRKLPPELRGQRNSVRSVPSCSLLPAFIICNTNNSCSFFLLLLLFGCKKIKSVVLSSFTILDLKSAEILYYNYYCFLLCSTFNAPSKNCALSRRCRGCLGLTKELANVVEKLYALGGGGGCYHTFPVRLGFLRTGSGCLFL